MSTVSFKHPSGKGRFPTKDYFFVDLVESFGGVCSTKNHVSILSYGEKTADVPTKVTIFCFVVVPSLINLPTKT
jgi:hypothetical protein